MHACADVCTAPPLPEAPLSRPARPPRAAAGYLKSDILTLKVGLILNAFAMYEFPLFATLAARKLGAPPKLTLGLWWLGMAVWLYGCG